MATRQDMWDALDGEFDVVVIGGGINGAGIARDAALRGLKVAMLEMRDLAYGTSSRSSKLVHGGLRYLENYEFALVFESVSERRLLLDVAPHLVTPLGFLFPVYKHSRRGPFIMRVGMWVYEALALFRSPKKPGYFAPKALTRVEPSLGQGELLGAPRYYDCATDDARLTLESALDAAACGAVVATHVAATAMVHGEDGRVCGVEVRDQRTGAVRRIGAGVVVNATGPWTDRTLSLGTTNPGAKSLLRPTKGVHIVVPAAKLPLEHAIVIFHPEDGRVLFALPWGTETYVGTTDTDFSGDPSGLRATAEDVRYLVAACGAYFPDHPVQDTDVISTWAGLRPLMRPVDAGDDVDESAVSREHQIVTGKDGVVTIAGGKLTTFRRMAAECVDVAVAALKKRGKAPTGLAGADTKTRKLPGAAGWPRGGRAALVEQLIVQAAQTGLSRATLELLAATYGTRASAVVARVEEDAALGVLLDPARPEIVAQVDHAVQVELAASVDDVLVRRTQVFFRAHDQGLAAAEVTADRMATLLGWTPEERAVHLEQYRAEVALSRAWRDEP